ncbi:multiheme c-type cytochrome [Danxiaibacter flavus]|uniref:Multiheme c-type cytochrome n=1 Tax=Danxiaibacter flavus TaxID=3049108 RepID=A0ABV3ZN21_9BACT|nr:multiheme c-type cytochrome [Chitinophagaceae bacterium DXS]
MKKGLVICCLAVILVIFITCTDQAGTGDARGDMYAGAATCVSCHKNIADLYSHDHHFNSSGTADPNDLRRIITDSNNTVQFINGQRIVLSEQGATFYQTSYKGSQLIHAEKMDVVFGSAIKAQTFGYWKDSQLYQLPLTYLTKEKLWTNSPGFPVDHPYFTRPIVSRCLECHASFARVSEKREGNLLRTKQVYDPSLIIYGIDCERCHGPAAEHVKFHSENPAVKQAKYITSIKALSRQQQLDLCGTCHSGDPVNIRSIFNFKPGDTLSKYYVFYSGASGEPDVHGMQSQLLQLSKCFKQSQMTCSNCHATHQAESTQLFIDQCTACHQQVKHTVDIKTAGNNCITCHMPLRPSKSLDFNNETEAHNIRYMLRTHRIAVYPAEQWK